MIGFLREGKEKNDKEVLVQEVFYMDSFDLSKGLEMHQIVTIIQTYENDPRYTIEDMRDIVFRYLFLNAGGTDNTPPEEVASFCYLTFCTDNFAFNKKVQIIISGVTAAIILKKAEQHNIDIPSFIVKNIIDTIGMELWEELSKNHEVNVTPYSNITSSLQFVNKLIALDKSTEGALNNLLGKMGIDPYKPTNGSI